MRGSAGIWSRILPVLAAIFAVYPVMSQAQEPQSESESPTTTVGEEGEHPKKIFRFLFKSNGSKVDADASRRRGRRNREQLLAEGADSLAADSLATDSVWYDGAHIEFDETVWDFGEIARRGGDVSKEFNFVNDGSKPLVITGITMSCTCIKVVYPKRPVAAGGSGTIKLIYEPHKMSPGTFYRVVQVHSNSVDGVRLLTVHGNSVNGRRL